MYSIVMVAAMTAAPEAPDFFCCKKSYSYGCCGGYSCCGGCCGGGWGYGGCCGGGCCGGWSCGGCCGGYVVSGCWGCCGGGCCGGYTMGCTGCTGCLGGYVVPSAPMGEVVPNAPGKPVEGKEMKEAPKTKGSSDVPISFTGIPATRAQVVVRMAAEAKLYADGQATTLAGTERVFQTPDLTPGRDFQYTLKVEGVDGKTTTRQVLVRAGHRTTVDFVDGSEQASTAITVNLPAKAKLFVDGVTTPATGGTHTFQTPELTKGKAYVYTFRAEVEKDGKNQVEVREVTFKGGETVTVDFTEANPVRTASAR